MAGVKPPVFVHCYPRVGSTWFSSLLIKHLDDAHFHEPLHPFLLNATAESAKTYFEKLRQGRSLRHPPRANDYFFNYPFKPEGGVPGFQERFCLEDYAPDPRMEDPELEAYWENLIVYAKTKGPQISFKDTSTPLRQGWLKAHFGGVHIYLAQHPRLTDKSYFSFRGFNNYYIYEKGLIAGWNRNNPALRELFNWMAIQSPAPGLPLQKAFRHYSKLFSRRPENRDPRFTRQFHYNVFCYLWMAGLAHASRHADVIVDMEALRDTDKRVAIEARIREQTGLSLDLSGYKPKPSKETVPEENFLLEGGMIEAIKRGLPHLDPDWERMKNFPLSKVTAQAVECFRAGSCTAVPAGLFSAMPAAL